MAELAQQIRSWAHALGFRYAGITDTDLSQAGQKLRTWLANGMHGDMAYMARHADLRARPGELLAGTVRVISVGMDYWPHGSADPDAVLADPQRAYISRYALGRDYHKVLRGRLKKLVAQIQAAAGELSQRVFVDSAPVMEKPLAEKAGLGWIGKHTNVLNEQHGSWFFLGEIYTSLALPLDRPARNHCGTCQACIDACPTEAITAPYQLDARRCISYLTIEHRGSIPVELRAALGNRIYGCDDCQLVCPWNRFAKYTAETDFMPRHGLDAPQLVALFAWDEATYLARSEGMALRRIDHVCWLRNIAVALGNAGTTPEVIAALQSRRDHPAALVREHVVWALSRHNPT